WAQGVGGSNPLAPTIAQNFVFRSVEARSSRWRRLSSPLHQILSPRPSLKTSFFARSRRGLPVGGDSRRRCTESSRADPKNPRSFGNDRFTSIDRRHNIGTSERHRIFDRRRGDVKARLSCPPNRLKGD